MKKKKNAEDIFRKIIADAKTIFATRTYHEHDIRLHMMEFPCDVSEQMKGDIREAMDLDLLNRYPSSEVVVIECIKNAFKIPNELGVLLGSGAADLIRTITWAFSVPGASMLFPSPGFFLFKRYAEQAHFNPVGVLLKHDFSLDLPAFLSHIERYQPKLIFIDNPNNPTGSLFDAHDILKIVKSTGAIVVVDEVYGDYAKTSLLSKLPEHNNLVIIKSFSKIGFAGLRFGYMVAQPEIIDYVQKIHLSFAINSITLSAVHCLLTNYKEIHGKVDEIIKQRELLYKALQNIDGVQPYPSQANFILFKVPSGKANQINQYLLDKQIIINNICSIHPLLMDCMRVTVGTEKENKLFLEALDSIKVGK